MTTTQPLQYAQIIADLQTLQNADPAASLNLLTSHHQLSQPKKRTLSLPDAPKFDRLGRRITSSKSLHKFSFTPSSAVNNIDDAVPTPPLSQPSTPGPTEGHGNERNNDKEEDLSRAKTLMELYAQRDSLGSTGERGLGRAREKVQGVMREYNNSNASLGDENTRGRI